VTLRPRIVQIDVAAPLLAATTSFWSAALSATPVDAASGFVHLSGTTSAMEVHLQSIGAGPPRYHLDLEADDRNAEVARLVELGAGEVARFAEGFTVLEDPAGLLLCVVDADAAEPTPLAPRSGEHGYLDAIFVDVPDDVHDREVTFWAEALGATVEPPSPEAPAYTVLQGVEGPGGRLLMAVQRVDSPARYHIDLSATDVAREVARLEGLGASRVAEVEDWVTLADPAGNLLCVVPAT
jgi:predicted enzyme related to lactoylglutathione lyase